MIDAAFAIPGDLDAATGGYAYARKVFQLLPEFGVTGHHLQLPGSFPTPSSDDLASTRRLLDQIHPETPILFDGLAFGALPSGFLDGLEAPIIALVHHPLAMETGLTATQQRAFEESERPALAHAKRVIATSAWTARTLVRDYGVSAEHVTVAEPGTAPAKRSIGTGKPHMLLAVGSLIPRKAYTVLIDALAELDRHDWQLTIVGSLDHDPAEANRVRERVLAHGLRGRITIAGRVSGTELADLYARADLFMMPSLYEGYGMALAEAMARGLPIVCTTGGAAAETVPDGAAIKVRPGDVGELSQSIACIVGDDALRARMRDAAWAAGQLLPRWPDSVAKIATTIKAVHAEQIS